MTNTIEIPFLDANKQALSQQQLEALFSCQLSLYPSWETGISPSGGDTGWQTTEFVEGFIGHIFNQTLQRDMVFGAWAEVGQPHDSQTFVLKMTSPDAKADLSPYARKVPAFVHAGLTGYQIFEKNQKKVPKGFQFLLPFGLALTEVRSIQLLHFPPTTTFTYLDYLYSSTNRRWESLLQFVGYDGSKNTLVERVVDVVPIAAPGGAGTQIAPLNDAFVEYGQQMLQAVIDTEATGGIVQPIVAYGGPVHGWLNKVYPSQIPPDPEINATYPLQLSETPKLRASLMIANHPSDFLFFLGEYTRGKVTIEKLEAILTQDLIAAQWQKEMSAQWSLDGASTAKKIRDYWNSSSGQDKVKDFVNEQIEEFGYTVTLARGRVRSARGTV